MAYVFPFITTISLHFDESRFDEWYFGMSANPMEVVFFKNNRENSKLEQRMYQQWIMKTKDLT